MPQFGCDAITSYGACFSYFSAFSVSWREARIECLLGGYDLASIASLQENSLVVSTSMGGFCWIGLSDIGHHLTFTWIDGSDSILRRWYVDSRPYYPEKCVCVQMCTAYTNWFYASCTDHTLSCYYCRANSKCNLYILCVCCEVELFQ